MRKLKRLLLPLIEVGVLGLGFVVSIALGAFVHELIGLGFFAFCSGLLVTSVGFLMILRRHRTARFEYDVVGWEIARADRKVHPRCDRVKKVVWRILVWVPSAVAALVLFFFPVASHLLHPSSRYLRHYRIPIPWTVTILSPVFSQPELAPESNLVEAFVSNSAWGQFGVTPFWGRKGLSSTMGFMSVNPHGRVGYNNQPTLAIRRGAADVTRREFQLGNVTVACWQYVLRHRPGYPYRTGPWEVSCSTSEDVHEFNLRAWFYGEDSDLPIFYKTIEGVAPVE